MCAGGSPPESNLPDVCLKFLDFSSITLDAQTRNFTFTFIHSFIHSTGMCGMRRFLAVLMSSFRSSLLCTFSCYPSPPTIISSSLTSTCYLFLGLPLSLVVLKFIYNTFWGILFSSILSTCPNQRNLFNLNVSVIVGFLTIASIFLLVNILQFSFSLSCTGPKILQYTFLSKMFNWFLSLFVSIQFSDTYVNVLSIVFFNPWAANVIYIYMEHPFLMFLDHTQQRTTVGRTPLDE